MPILSPAQNLLPCSTLNAIVVSVLFLTISFLQPLWAQLYVPPDPFGGAGVGVNYLRESQGQIIRTDESSLTDCAYYYENVPVSTYLRRKSKVSFVLGSIHQDTISPDTLYRIDMTLGGTDVAPAHAGADVGGVSNYYLGGVVAESVKAHERVIYPEAWDSTDVHFYYGPSGPRMAIVMRPGASPENVKLSFAGQDSIKVDWQGHLKLHIGEKWVEMNQAIAYQVGGNGDVIPVNWLPDYYVEPGNVTVGFQYEAYNPNWPLVLLAGYPGLSMPPTENGNLGWCTYTGSPRGDELTSVEMDEDGDPYTCGYLGYFFFPLEYGISEFSPSSPGLAEGRCAVAMKFNKANKQIRWTSYIGGTQEETRAAKLAVYTGSYSTLQHVFVTGTTKDPTLSTYRKPLSAYAGAYEDANDGGVARMWLAAFSKVFGTRYWVTTHGQPGPNRTWSEHGLAIAIDRQGHLAVGGMLEQGENDEEPDLPLVTPTGAFSRALGDGFLISFDEDFQIEWSTALMEFSGGYAVGRVNDMRMTATAGDQVGVWVVGASIYGTNEPLDLVPPPSGGYYQAIAGELSAVIMQIDLNNHAIEYCTRWGSPTSPDISSAYGVHETEEFVYVVGFVEAFDLTTTECPPPPACSGIIYSTYCPTGTDQPSQGFLLRFERNSGFALDYGTLFGGALDDIILDVNGDGEGNVYLTGETRSGGSDITMMPPNDLYNQLSLGMTNRRDAFIVGIKDETCPTNFWKSAFGGARSERGWGIAASEDEVYHCGSTGSAYNEAFPMREWNTDPNDPESLLDWYLECIPEGVAEELVPWVRFNLALDYETGNFDDFIEGLNSVHDGYIASFNMDPSVGIFEESASVAPPSAITARPWGSGAGYDLLLLEASTWKLSLFDARGALIRTDTFYGRTFALDLAQFPSGLYLLTASCNGVAHSVKLNRP